jgi:cold shock CspA family protein
LRRNAVQATVATFSAATGCGTVLRDNGFQLSFDGETCKAGGLLHLRPGQRVTIAVTGDRVSALAIGPLDQREC